MDKKKLFARLFYSIGVVSGQLYLLAKSIHKATWQFSEFDKWFKKNIKAERIKQKIMIKELKIAGKRGDRAGRKLRKIADKHYKKEVG